MKKVLCIGSVTVDIIVSPVDCLPEPGALKAVGGISTHVGGCAANAAIDLAKLSVPVTLCCKVGKDTFGELVAETAKKEGVDISGIISGDTPTTVSVVCVNSSGERSFLYYPGSAAVFRAEEISETLLERNDILFIAGAMLLTDFDGQPCAEILKKAQSLGKMTVMDTAWDFDGKWLPKIQAALPYLDLFMPSYEEAVRLSGETELQKIADCFFRFGVKSVIIKTGKDGAYICEDAETRFTSPAYRNIQPVDTTGAGDAFCAGFLCGLAQGLPYRESARLGNAVGTHCIMAIGASSGIRPLDEINRYIQFNHTEGW